MAKSRAARSSYSRSEYSDARPRKRVVTVHVPLPVSKARQIRTVLYPYPNPRQRRNHVVRTPLRVRPGRRFVWTRVRVLVPFVLPAVSSSYVSIDRQRLNVHSLAQVTKLMSREFNRPRYDEEKSNRRKARHGQLESVRSDPYGMIAAAAASRAPTRVVADAALVSRALSRRRF